MTGVTRRGPRAGRFAGVLALLLLAAAAHGEAQSPHYLRLQSALDLYLHIAATGGWPAVPDGPTLAPGAEDARVAVLAQRLRATGDLPDDAQENTFYGEYLEAAVLRFQARHGLEQDALVGPATLRALRVPVEQRIAQLRVNLERMQKTFDPALTDYVLVNVPAFETYLYRDGARIWSGRIIVGETEAETPVLETQLTSVVLNPTWAVPRSIASEELLPKIQRNPGFLVNGGYDVLDADGRPVDAARVDWNSLHKNNFPYSLVQRPGPANELGRVKFIIPNPFGVCMHDTPGKYLFSLSSRAFTHGCIRMDEPLDFAAQVLAAENWTPAQIDAELETTLTRNIPLSAPLPVIVAYLTAVADAGGTVHFYRDIYGKDAL